MNYKYLIIVGFVFLLFTSFNSEGVYAENETVEDLISLELDNNRILEGELVEGKVTLGITDKVFITDELSVKVNGEEYGGKIKDILSSLNVTFLEQASELNSTNSSSTKLIVFDEPGDQYVGLQLPRYGLVNSFDMNIEGLMYEGSYVSNVTIDFGDDGTYDWYYFGSFENYNDEMFKSVDLDESVDGVVNLIGSNSYYCELIDVPETKNIKFFADYTKLGTVGDLKAVVLSAFGGDPTNGYGGGNDICDMPEIEGSCEIELSYPIEGEYLFCIYSDEADDDETPLYELPIDSTALTTTSYYCPITDVDPLCTPNYYDNFFINVNTAYYDKYLEGSVTYEDWETFLGSAKEGLKFYIGTEPYQGICTKEICIVPLRISSDTVGAVSLSSLNLNYNYYDQDIEKITTSFYDVLIAPNLISEIDKKQLIYGTSLEIDLSFFNITLLEGDYDLEVLFLDQEGLVNFSVLSEDEFYTPRELISDANIKYSGFLTSGTDENRVISMLDLDNDIEAVEEKLESYESQIGFVSDFELIEKIEENILSVPWEISFSQEVKDTQIVSPDDVSQIGDVYFLQDGVEVIGSSKKVTVSYFDGSEEEYRLIEKSVQVNNDYEDFVVYEISSEPISSLISYSTITPFSDYIGSYSVGEVVGGDVLEYYYLTNVDERLVDFTTVVDYEFALVIPECLDDDCPGICVSGECVEEKKFPWFIVGLVVLVVVAGVLYFIFSSRKKPLGLKSEIARFIRSSRAKGMKDRVIKKILIKKGWKKEEIDKEFREKDGSEISKFIKEARKKGISEPSIRQVLIKKGWKKEEIDKELRGK